MCWPCNASQGPLFSQGHYSAYNISAPQMPPSYKPWQSVLLGTELCQSGSAQCQGACNATSSVALPTDRPPKAFLPVGSAANSRKRCNFGRICHRFGSMACKPLQVVAVCQCILQKSVMTFHSVTEEVIAPLQMPHTHPHNQPLLIHNIWTPRVHKLKPKGNEMTNLGSTASKLNAPCFGLDHCGDQVEELVSDSIVDIVGLNLPPQPSAARLNIGAKEPTLQG